VTSAGNVVYRALDETGKTIYVGITNNLPRRAVEQLRAKGIEIDEIDGLTDLNRSDAQAVEQVLIESHGLEKNGGTLINKINSIGQTNPSYADALNRGKTLLSEAGYDAESLGEEAAAVAGDIPP
jgi:excinuclease UvrABC nuclease subunit